MNPPEPTRHKRRVFTWAVIVVAGLAGVKFGYDFGHRLSGIGLGVVTGLNAGLFCSVIADAALAWWSRQWSRWTAGRGGPT